jgi:uncharacterized protein (TIRG00374 family)
VSPSDDLRSRRSGVSVATPLRIVIAVGLTLYIFLRARPAQVGAALANASWTPIAMACVLVLIDRVLMGFRWVALLSTLRDRRPPLRELARVFFVSTFIGTFLPQSVGSDAVRVWSLARSGVPASASLASVLMDRLLGIVSILLSAGVGLAIAPRVLQERAVIVAFAVTAAACVAALAFVFSVRLDDLVRRSLNRLPVLRLRSPLARLLDALQAYRQEHGMLAAVLGASIVVQALRILQAWWLGQSLGIPASFESYLAFVPIILLVMLLPITINGLGVGNSAFVWAFAQVGVDPAQAFALSVLFIALGIVGNLPGGILYVTGRGQAVASDGGNGRLLP